MKLSKMCMYVCSIYFYRSSSKRNPLPKLVFSLMKDLVLRKKLKEFGLSSQGDRKALEARLQRYIVVYNAECDKSYPRPISELIKQCEEEENVERKISKTSLLNVNMHYFIFGIGLFVP